MLQEAPWSCFPNPFLDSPPKIDRINNEQRMLCGICPYYIIWLSLVGLHPHFSEVELLVLLESKTTKFLGDEALT